MSKRVLFLLILILMLPVLGQGEGAPKPDLNTYLSKGAIKEGEAAYLRYLYEVPGDDQARYELGVLQFLKTFEYFMASYYLYSKPADLPPGFPENPKGRLFNYAKAVGVLKEIYNGLATAEETLAQVKSATVKVPFYPGCIRFDINNNGVSDPWEGVREMIASLSMGSSSGPSDEEVFGFSISLDKADVYWLRGYCNLLMGILNMTLAYNWQVQFDFIAQYLPFNSPAPDNPNREEPTVEIVFKTPIPLIDGARFSQAREQFLAVIALSRQTWTAILAETDNDREWLPAPGQQSVVGQKVTQEMIDAWYLCLAEWEDLLNGTKVIQVDGEEGQGVSLKKIFQNPRTLDLSMMGDPEYWQEYITEGTIYDWEALGARNEIFSYNFGLFALWFN